MARKIARPGPGFVTFSEFARIVGVSRSAITKAYKSGRLQAYDADGRPIDADGRPRRQKAISRGNGMPMAGDED